MRKRRKQWGLSFKKIGDDLIAQKPMTLFKQIARHKCHRIFRNKIDLSERFSEKYQITLL
jgi:hypothetical protein